MIRMPRRVAPLAACLLLIGAGTQAAACPASPAGTRAPGQ